MNFTQLHRSRADCEALRHNQVIQFWLSALARAASLIVWTVIAIFAWRYWRQP